jgi:hypothetical protein
MNAPSHVGLRAAEIMCPAWWRKLVGPVNSREGTAASGISIGEF